MNDENEKDLNQILIDFSDEYRNLTNKYLQKLRSRFNLSKMDPPYKILLLIIKKGHINNWGKKCMKELKNILKPT